MYKYEFCPAELITHCIGEGRREGGKEGGREGKWRGPITIIIIMNTIMNNE